MNCVHDQAGVTYSINVEQLAHVRRAADVAEGRVGVGQRGQRRGGGARVLCGAGRGMCASLASGERCSNNLLLHDKHRASEIREDRDMAAL